MTTLNDFQKRVGDWAAAKGWKDLRIKDHSAEPKLVETNLARMAWAHVPIDHNSERIRIDPNAELEFPETPIPDEFPTHPSCNVTIVLSKLGLIHTEVTEAVEAVVDSGAETWFNYVRRNAAMPKGKPEGLGSELADVVIRCFQLADDIGIDLAKELEQKMDYNDGRPFQHGKQA